MNDAIIKFIERKYEEPLINAISGGDEECRQFLLNGLCWFDEDSWAKDAIKSVKEFPQGKW